jgi:hypothetical protein
MKPTAITSATGPLGSETRDALGVSFSEYADPPILKRRPLIAQVIKRQRLIRPLRPTP